MQDMGVALHGVGTGEPEMGECADRFNPVFAVFSLDGNVNRYPIASDTTLTYGSL
jgi:hypothetical protein